MRKNISKAIEKFKIVQRIVMVILTIAMICVMVYVGYEMKEMKIELNRVGTVIQEMNGNVAETVKAINLLQQTLKRSIFF